MCQAGDATRRPGGAGVESGQLCGGGGGGGSAATSQTCLPPPLCHVSFFLGLAVNGLVLCSVLPEQLHSLGSSASTPSIKR